MKISREKDKDKADIVENQGTSLGRLDVEAK